MKKNGITVLYAILLALLCVFKTEAKETGVVPGATAIVNVINRLFFPPPPIESILNNPAILKKQVSRNMVQASGSAQKAGAHFIVHFRKEQLHGEWESFYSTNERCDSGHFDKGVPDGEWKTWYPNGQLKTVRNYSSQKLHFIKADIQRNHPRHQHYAITRQAGKDYAKYFRPQYETDPAITQSLPMLQKIQYNTSVDAGFYLPPFQSCLHHGLYIDYAANGVVKDSGNYVNGLKHGLWKETITPDAMAAFGFYYHGIRQGQWKYYTNDGILYYTEVYNQKGKKREWHYFKK